MRNVFQLSCIGAVIFCFKATECYAQSAPPVPWWTNQLYLNYVVIGLSVLAIVVAVMSYRFGYKRAVESRFKGINDELQSKVCVTACSISTRASNDRIDGVENKIISASKDHVNKSLSIDMCLISVQTEIQRLFYKQLLNKFKTNDLQSLSAIYKNHLLVTHHLKELLSGEAAKEISAIAVLTRLVKNGMVPVEVLNLISVLNQHGRLLDHNGYIDKLKESFASPRA